MTSAISIAGVTKRFRIFHERHGTVKAMLFAGKGRRARYEEFLALDDVSFEVEKGTTFGLIGENGSGKSTLLKCVARILRPNSGSITVEGKASALLELGAGFHPELSGRENVYLNASILGLAGRDVDARFDDIVGFAGLERFIDTPVKNYSSGMFVRLGFAVAVNVEPDVLLVDEVLAVGDEAFQHKCAEKFAAMRRDGRTIVVVSHGLEQMRTMCDEIAWLDHGRLREVGPAAEVVESYLHSVRESERSDQPTGMHEGDILSVELLDAADRPAHTVHSGDSPTVQVRFRTAEAEAVAVELALIRTDGVVLAQFSSADGGHTIRPTTAVTTTRFRADPLPLLPGTYEISARVTDPARLHTHARVDRAWRFDVEPRGPHGSGIVHVTGAWTADVPLGH